MNKKTSFKNWSKLDKTTVSFVLGMASFCAVVTGLHIQETDYTRATFQGTCAAINTICAAKLIRDARKHGMKERD